MAEVITMDHVRAAAERIIEVNRRCYTRARAGKDYSDSNGFRTTCLDEIEGLKSLLIAANLHETETYRWLTQQWDEILNWP